MSDLSTTWLGLKLKNPLVPSPSPLCDDVSNIRKMEDNGAGAVVLHSLFEEQLSHESNALNENLMQGSESFAESLSYFPEMEDYHTGPDDYLSLIQKAKEAVDIPVIASLNGVSKGGWTDYAKKMEKAGADALELNVYFIPANPDMTGSEVREMQQDLVKDVKSNVSIPVAVKIGPYYSAVANLAKNLKECGADGLVMFNRFYQPDFDLDKLEVKTDLTLSRSAELLLRLRWVAILYGRVDIDMAVTGGIHTPEDLVKSLMAGAKAGMTTSALLQNGIEHLKVLRDGLLHWMEDNEYESVEMMQGCMSQKSVGDPAAFERANYMRILTSYTPNI
jgi:dihydroorotate dehydrogenase (fumarate)